MSDLLISYELYHHGVIGQKWGVRRYQYQDGSLTPEGLKRYSRGDVHRIKREFKKEAYKENREQGMGIIKSYMNAGKEATKKTIEVVGKKRYNQVKAQDTAIGVGSALVAAYLAASVGNNIEIRKNYNKEWNDAWDRIMSDRVGGKIPKVSQAMADKYRNSKSSDLPDFLKDLGPMLDAKETANSKIYLNPFLSAMMKIHNV